MTEPMDTKDTENTDPENTNTEMEIEMPLERKDLKRKLPADFDDPILRYSDVPAYRIFWTMPVRKLKLEIEKISQGINVPVDPNVYGEMIRVLLIRQRKKEAATHDWNDFSDESDGLEVDNSAVMRKYGLKYWEQSDEDYSPEFGDSEASAMRGGELEIQDSDGDDAAVAEETNSDLETLDGSEVEEQPDNEDVQATVVDEDFLHALAALELACQNFRD